MGELDREQAKRLGVKVADWEARLSEVEALRQAAQEKQAEQVSPEQEVEAALALLDRLDSIQDDTQEDRRQFFQRAVAGVVRQRPPGPGPPGISPPWPPSLSGAPLALSWSRTAIRQRCIW